MEVDKDLLDNIIMDIDEIPLTENDKTMIKHETSDDDLEEILSSPTNEYGGLKTEAKSIVPMTLTKIAPKPISTTKAVPGQIVVIQRPGGTTQQIRIAGTSNTPSSSGPIKLIKTADGKLLRISSTKKPTTPTSANSSVQVKRVISKNSAGQIITTSAQSVGANASSTPTGVKRTFTVAQAQQMGLISSSKLKELVSQATAQKQGKINTPLSPENNRPTTTISPTGKVVTQKVIIQTPSGEQKQVSLPPNLIKLAQSGQIKAVNVAGKGIQYVRVMGSNSSATSSPTKPSQQTVTKAPPKVFVHNKGAPNQNSRPSLVQTSKPTTVGLAIGSNVVRTNNAKDSFKTVGAGQRFSAGQPSTSKAVLIKEEDSATEDRTHFVLVTKPKFIKVEGGNDSAQPASPRKTQNVTLEAEEDDDVALMKSSQSSDEGIRRKHCNCNKSMCLKLYCDCFANGEFCFNCNCKECFNNLENEEERQRAIRICLERNPAAFKPKIGKARDQLDSANRKHTKGCNCKRSGCLKNYCECYEAKIACSDNCKCVGCRNIDMDESMYENNASAKLNNSFDKSFIERTTAENRLLREMTPPSTTAGIGKRSCNFMTSDVIEATIQCVIAQAEECQKTKMDPTTAEKMILEEFGRCLVEINEFSNKSGSN
ncbi:protein lin-54 homolog isoform X3 [Bradysia coprophila]|nr:protein lin-54 homolog isoform X2 [Bradysia coprophila]XP_037040067.1 protein lin-54 homolog isoform X3 [Bradysia coprophila]